MLTHRGVSSDRVDEAAEASGNTRQDRQFGRHSYQAQLSQIDVRVSFL